MVIEPDPADRYRKNIQMEDYARRVHSHKWSLHLLMRRSAQPRQGSGSSFFLPMAKLFEAALERALAEATGVICQAQQTHDDRIVIREGGPPWSVAFKPDNMLARAGHRGWWWTPSTSVLLRNTGRPSGS